MKVGDLVKVRDGVGGLFKDSLTVGIIMELDPNYKWVMLHSGEKFFRGDCRVVLESESYESG
ncbi:MAG: hypothetical protein CL885_04545 [Dehalococcoidia bacterium]|nr:hypothetical protein [Dehalococcoidia bacterium]|tara:strand:- start:177 stop:362 length:186 start_codon:yes stop_codon:yes gene_type:complete